MSDPRTPAEKRYDAERNGSLYTTDATADEILILDWIDKQAALRLGSLIVTESAHYCVSSDAETPNIRAAAVRGAPKPLTIGYDGDPDGPATITEVWHSATAPIVVVLTNDNELWVLHPDEWGSQV